MVLAASCRVVALATEWSSAHGGLSTFNRKICGALAVAGADVFCIALTASRAEIDDARAAGVTLLEAPRTPGGLERDALMRRPRLPGDVVPDIIIGHGRVTGPAAMALAEDHYPGAARIHVVHMAPDEIEWLKPDRDDDAGERAEARTRAEVHLGRGAARVAAVGPRLWNRFRRELSVFPGTPPPLRLDPGFDGGSQEFRHPPPGEPLQVLLVGRLEDSEIKGLDVAARAVAVAMSLLGPAEPRIELRIRGAPHGQSTALYQTVLSWAGLPGLPSLNVVVRPYSADAERLEHDLRQATLVLMPSRAEGFGLVGLEAIMAGTPVLVSGSSGLGDLLLEVLPPELSARTVRPVTGDADDAQVWGHSVAAALQDRDAAFADAAQVLRRMGAARTWAMAAEQLLGAAQAWMGDRQGPRADGENTAHATGRAATDQAPNRRPGTGDPPSGGSPARSGLAQPAGRRPPKQLVVGRNDEVRELAALQAGTTRHPVANIYGPGGIGKTAVFDKFIAFGEQHGSVIGHADVADIRHAEGAQPLTAAEILRTLATTVGRSELDPFDRDLHDFDLATTAVRAAGGADGLFGPTGRLLGGASLEQAAEGGSLGLRDAARSRFAFERYLRRAPTALTRAFCDGLGAVAEAGGGITALLLDTYEEIGGLDDWVCRDLVPALPEHARLVIAGRRQLTKTNIDWLDHQHFVRARSLPELPEDDAKAYLCAYGLTEPGTLHKVYAVTGGYPLLLVLARALAFESGGWEPIDGLAHDRDRDAIASGLLEQILREERVRRVREVLETCSIAPWIDPGIIRALLGVTSRDARDLYTELSAHTIVTRHPRGVVLHDKIRELLQVRLRFADEARYEELRSQLARYLAGEGGAGDSGAGDG